MRILDAPLLKPEHFADARQKPAEREYRLALNAGLLASESDSGTGGTPPAEDRLIVVPQGRTMGEADFQSIVRAMGHSYADRLDVSQLMLALEYVAEHFGGDAGDTAEFLKGLLLFNTSYFGNGRELTGWSIWGADNRNFLNRYGRGDPAFSEYYVNNDALRAFARVAEKSGNRELRARALYMASYCLQGYKSFLRLKDGASYDWEKTLGGPYFVENPHFSKLGKEYADTDYYKAARDACSYLRDFERTSRSTRQSSEEARKTATNP